MNQKIKTIAGYLLLPAIGAAAGTIITNTLYARTVAEPRKLDFGETCTLVYRVEKPSDHSLWVGDLSSLLRASVETCNGLYREEIKPHISVYLYSVTKGAPLYHLAGHHIITCQGAGETITICQYESEKKHRWTEELRVDEIIKTGLESELRKLDENYTLAQLSHTRSREPKPSDYDIMCMLGLVQTRRDVKHSRQL